ncbi:nucleolar complex-associated protein 3 [Exidia glandulosa HHB12029]|uniref:Nucleolar complex-associated protein 3 n=1 Tax=Exidia glandulosa HHB12029 TaxID=1314781 RepID=A0A165GVN6_EXIGL|nr:nucleolar complex-associated protein 3 [Exidia glandulosa HHB12029]
MKRPASSKPDGSKPKRRKVAPGAPKSKPATGKKKEKAHERTHVPIPDAGSDVSDLGDDDLEFFQENLDAGAFLKSLDHKGISRSKKETERLHQFYKPARPQKVADDLPSLNSDDDVSSDELDAAMDDDASSVASSSGSAAIDSGSDVEQSYERIPRTKPASPRTRETKEVARLPIKLSDGRVKETGSHVVANDAPRQVSDESDEEEEVWEEEMPKVEDVTTGARFGRLAVVDVLRISSRKQRVQAAKEQIASLCQEIIADPENNLALLRRLVTFSLEKVTSPAYPDPVPNDPIIRKLAILSQMNVFKDVAPGYRIRALTDKEKSEKVSQMVQRTRDWEQGLVTVYQSYLRTLDDALKSKSELAPVALQCMATLLSELTHFTFRANLMGAIVRQLSRKSWDSSSELCQKTVISVFRNDETGEASLELVRLLNRMIKERHFNVHGNVLSCLMHLRLKSELHVRASDTKAEKDEDDKPKMKKRGKDKKEQYLSKKERKNLKERKVIEKELREADAEVDKEERAKTHTETLKLLFVLYFRILKNPRRTPLLTPALRGIARFAHLVNVDFFRDLLKVLQEHVARGGGSNDEDSGEEGVDDHRDLQYRLQCIVTAFELLSGQGEAIMIDLEDFVTHLYKLIPLLASCRTLEEPVEDRGAGATNSRAQTLSSMMIRALTLALAPRSNRNQSSPTRTAAFIKRLLTACLSLPSSTAQQVLVFIHSLVAEDPRLDALFSTEERCANGRYRPDLDDPQLSCPWSTSAWEVVTLCQQHWDPKVREQAVTLADFVRA